MNKRRDYVWESYVPREKYKSISYTQIINGVFNDLLKYLFEYININWKLKSFYFSLLYAVVCGTCQNTSISCL